MALAILLSVYDRNFKFKKYPNTVLHPFRELQSIVDNLTTTKAAVERDTWLTSAGKDHAKVEAGIKALRAVNAWLKPKLERLDADLAARKAALPTLPPPDAAKVNVMLSKLQSFTPEERAVLYNSATDEERRLMEGAHAVAGRMPMKSGNGIEWGHLLDPEMVAESVNARLAATHPEAFERVQELSALREMHQTVANQATADVREALAAYKVDEKGAEWVTRG